MKTKLQHAPMTAFPIIGGEICAGGHPISRLALRAGQTPFYVYDRHIMTEKVKQLREHFPSRLELHYAIKANPMPAVVQHLSQLTDGLDVASIAELQIALHSGANPAHISFAGPGKTDKELTCALAAGVIINMESESEMERIAAIGQASNLEPHVAIRINPDFELKTSGMKMGGGPKAFGVDAERVPTMIQRCLQLGLNLKGFHIFCGSQNLRADAIIEAHNNTFELAYRLLQESGVQLEWLNIGGGLGIPYFPGEAPLDLSPIADNLTRLMGIAEEKIPNTRIIMELGRFLVGESGLYVSKVIDRKLSRGANFVITDGGLHHHLAASGNFGQVIRKNYPVIIANKADLPPQSTTHIVGPLCTPLDIIADSVELPEVAVGDLIAVYQSGAYGFTASPRDFLSHPHPVEILV